MKKKEILIYDDEQGRSKEFKKKLEIGLKEANQNENFEITPLCHNEFQKSIKALQERRLEFRRKQEIRLEEGFKDEGKKIDDASIFIIDYDLFGNQVREPVTGEDIAYVIRCFSRCKLIIGLNQYGMNSFDLTLRGHPESFADLNLGEYQLSNPDLWRGNWGDFRRGFRPWYWPNLSNLLRDFEERVKDVQKNLDRPICEVLDPVFGPKLFQLLPREIIRFIGKYDEKKIFQTTFREFVVKSRNGLKLKDVNDLNEHINDYILARIGAARISKWLERYVLPAQNTLVDAPHLVSRYPSLLEDGNKKIGTWNKTAQLVDHHKLGLDTDLIEPYRFKNDYWISRPVWFWSELRECENIPEVVDPWLTDKPNWVFCEDASRFHDQKSCQEFLAHTTPPFTRRFVKHFKRVNNKIVRYEPEVQFWL